VRKGSVAVPNARQIFTQQQQQLLTVDVVSFIENTTFVYEKVYKK
jgi:hypothetical protein